MQPSRPTALLVEDNSTDVLVILEVLAQSALNFRVDVASNGLDALIYLERSASDGSAPRPSLVLLDLNVPKITGIELLQMMRTNQYCGGVPVIIITSSHADSDRAAAKRLGADAYFQKPVDLDAYQQLAEIVKGVTEGPAA